MLKFLNIFKKCNIAYCIVLALSKTLFFLQNEIISTRKKVELFKSFSLKNPKMHAILRSSRSHLPNLFFEPYLINIKCSLSLKYGIQLEVPFSRYSGSP